MHTQTSSTPRAGVRAAFRRRLARLASGPSIARDTESRLVIALRVSSLA